MAEERGGQLETADDVVPDQIPFHSTNLLTLLDADGGIQYESPAVARIYGYEPAEMVGEQVADYFHPEDRAAVVGAFRTVVESDEYVTEAVEYRHLRADGTYCWVESVSSSEPTPAGHYVVNTRDISERKARERELLRANRRLQEFAVVLSHDLRNPLQVAQGRLELLDDGDHVAAIAAAHDRMEALIDDLLTLANDDETIGDQQPVDLPALAEECWETVPTGGATLTVDARGTVWADRSRLRQLLSNLIRNAVEHGSRGTGERVTVEVGTFGDGFYVADDGPGIDDDARDRIFRMGHTGEHGGTGIGLSIVDQVSRAHNWELGVTDSADGGARFEFTGVEFADTG